MAARCEGRWVLPLLVVVLLMISGTQAAWPWSSETEGDPSTVGDVPGAAEEYTSKAGEELSKTSSADNIRDTSAAAEEYATQNKDEAVHSGQNVIHRAKEYGRSASEKLGETSEDVKLTIDEYVTGAGERASGMKDGLISSPKDAHTTDGEAADHYHMVTKAQERAAGVTGPAKEYARAAYDKLAWSKDKATDSATEQAAATKDSSGNIPVGEYADATGQKFAETYDITKQKITDTAAAAEDMIIPDPVKEYASEASQKAAATTDGITGTARDQSNLAGEKLDSVRYGVADTANEYAGSASEKAAANKESIWQKFGETAGSASEKVAASKESLGQQLGETYESTKQTVQDFPESARDYSSKAGEKINGVKDTASRPSESVPESAKSLAQGVSEKYNDVQALENSDDATIDHSAL